MNFIARHAKNRREFNPNKKDEVQLTRQKNIMMVNQFLQLFIVNITNSVL